MPRFQVLPGNIFGLSASIAKNPVACPRKRGHVKNAWNVQPCPRKRGHATEFIVFSATETNRGVYGPYQTIMPNNFGELANNYAICE
jgi:hypothetical protein